MKSDTSRVYTTVLLVLAGLFVLLMVIGSVTWMIVQWHECRGMDFSILYCIKHVL